MNVTLPDGTTIQDVPEGTTKAQLAEKLKANGMNVPQEWFAPVQPAQPAAPAQRRVPTQEEFSRMSDPWFKGLVESGLSLGSGIVGSAAGGLSQMATSAYEGGRELLGGQQIQRPIEGGQQLGSPAQEVGKEVSQAFTYEPRSRLGQAVTGGVGQVMSGFGAVPWLAEKGRELERSATGGRTYLTDTLYGAAASAPALTRGLKEFKEKGLADKQEELNVQQRMNAPTDKIRDAMQTPDQTGLKFITPSEKGIEAQYGAISSKTNQAISAVNEEAATRMAANEIGLPKDQPFTPETIQAKVNEANQAYSNLVEQAYGALPPKPTYTGGVSVGTMAPKMESAQATIRQTPEFRNAIEGEVSRLKDISSGNESAFKSLKTAIPVLNDELKNLKQDPKSVLRRIQMFRDQAKETMGSAAPSKIDLEQARAKMFIANKLEDLIEQNLAAQGKTGLVQQMREARVKLAQINAVQDALTVDGKISIKKMAKIDEKTGGGLLTGNLKRIATMGQKYPLGAQDIKGPVTPLSYFDAILGTASLAAGHVEGLGLVLGKAVVPTLARMGRLQSKTPDYVAKPSLPRAATANIATGIAATQAERERQRRKQERAK